MARESRVLTLAAVQHAQARYAEVDELGRRKHTMAAIADELGVGETTVYRAIRRQGIYAAMPQALSEPEMLSAAAASAERLLQRLAEAEAPKLDGEDDAKRLARERGWIE